MAKTSIIVNADDFGLSRDISDAIVRGHDGGLITSTTLIATAPAAEYAASLAKLRPDLAVGIHLNITTGRPLADPGKLGSLVTSEGVFRADTETSKRVIFDPRLIGPIVEEYSRQVERGLELGITPTHCDTHHGMHRFPVVFQAFRQTLLRYRIQAARSQVSLVIRAKASSNPRGSSIDVDSRWDWGIDAAWKRLCMLRMRRSGIRTPDAQLRANVDGLGEIDPHDWFDLLARHAPHGTYEIVLHPGMPEGSEVEPSRSAEIRRRDTALANQSELPGRRLSGTSVRLISYLELARLPR